MDGLGVSRGLVVLNLQLNKYHDVGVEILMLRQVYYFLALQCMYRLLGQVIDLLQTTKIARKKIQEITQKEGYWDISEGVEILRLPQVCCFLVLQYIDQLLDQAIVPLHLV